MKLAHISLIAVLSLPSASWALGILTNPGPHVLKRDMPACQNMLDYDDLQRFQSLKNKPAEAETWARLGAPEMESRNRLCIKLRKGWTVTVVERPLGFECLKVRERPSNHCFWTGNVSGTLHNKGYETPVYDGFYPLD